MMGGYQPGQTYTTAPGGAFPGSSGQAPSGLSGGWANVEILIGRPKPVTQEFMGPGANATPEGYVPRGPNDTRPVAPATTLQQLLTDFDLGQGQIFSNQQLVTNIQQALWEGGFYGNHKKLTFTPGQRDYATRTALEKAAKEAARHQAVLGEFLTERAQARVASGQAGAGSGSTAEPLRATNPADLAALAQQVAQKAWGRGLTDAEQAKLTGALQSFEAPYLAAHGSVAPPGAAAFQQQAEHLLRGMAPTEAGSHDVINVIDGISNILAGGSSG